MKSIPSPSVEAAFRGRDAMPDQNTADSTAMRQVPCVPLYRLLLAIMVAAFAIGFGEDATMASTPYTYVYQGVEEPLFLDTRNVAVFGLDPAAATDGPRAISLTESSRVALGLRRHGLAPSLAQAWPVRGWSLVPTPDAWLIEPLPAVEQTLATRFEERLARIASDLPSSAGFVSPIFTNGAEERAFLTPDILIGFTPTATGRIADVLQHAFSHCGPQAEAVEPWQQVLPGVFRLRTDLTNGFDVLRLANHLATLPGVQFAEPDFITTVKRNLIPNDPDFDKSWGLNNEGQTGGVDDADIDAVEAWDTTTGSNEVIVAVIDDGIEWDHPDIRQIRGVDLTSDGGDGGPVNDFDIHGTAVAGIITGRINNQTGSLGVAPQCYSVSVRTLISIDTQRSTSQFSWTVDALIWAWANGAQITNNSNEYPFRSSSIANAYDATRELGLTHFASAGNGGIADIAYPGRLKSVNAVGAFNANGQRTNWSNYGEDLFALAPGEAIFTTDRSGRLGFESGPFTTVSGTAFSTAFASGVAALVYSVRPRITPDELQLVLERSCVDMGVPGFDVETGWGFINADQAVSGPVETAKFIASDGQEGDAFGHAVDISGDVAIVGAYLDDEGATKSGAAFIYRLDRQNDQWVEEAKLLPSFRRTDGYFGFSVAIDGDVAVIGAPFDNGTAINSGAVYVFRYDPQQQTWSEEARLFGSTTNQFDAFGFSVDIRGDMIAAGAYLDQELGLRAGAAFVFEWDLDSGQWLETGRLQALDGGADDWFGFSIAIDPILKKVVVGAARHQGYRGAAYVFYFSPQTGWTQEAKLMASDNNTFDWFGYSVDINDNFLMIGAPLDDDRGADSGSVYIFRYARTSARWIEQQKISASEGLPDDHFGHAVRMTPSTAVISAVYDDEYGNNAGTVYIYRF
ncbi:MAG: S8 family serine peptidase, partial [Planctomycetota bacterium]